MERPFRPESHEDSDDLILHVYHEIAGQEASDPHRIEYYLQELAEAYEDTDAMTLLITAAELIQPLDRSQGGSDNLNASAAFCRGGLIGLRLAHGILGDDFSENITECKFDIVDADMSDTLEAQHQIASGIADIGARGYEDADPYQEFIEEIEDELCPDVRMQPYMRRGFGVIMYQVNKFQETRSYAEDMAALEIFAREQAPDYDWDKAFAEYLGNETP